MVQNKMQNMLSGIILAGGKNTRMGTNKAFLKIKDKMIIETIIEKFLVIFDEIIIVTNNREEYLLNLPSAIISKVKFIKDIFPDKGSLGGLYSGLVGSKNKNNFVVACDMPFLNMKLILLMINLNSGYDIVVPKFRNHYEALHAIYSKKCIPFIEKQIKKGNLKITDFYRHFKIYDITEDIINRFDPELYSFLNVNTADDYQKAKNII